jgi:CO dehydrogenase nickel-insertion accessory protein CooC1
VNSDAVITVVDPNYTSFKIAENVERLVTEMKTGAEKMAEKMVKKIGTDIIKAKEATKNLRTKHAWTVLNKVDSPKMEGTMRKKLKEIGIDTLGTVHYDPEISNSILMGIPLGKGKAMEDVEEIVKRIENLV